MKVKEIIEGITATPALPKAVAVPKPTAATTPVNAMANADKARVDALKTTADAAKDRVKKEQDRQKQQKAVQTLSDVATTNNT